MALTKEDIVAYLFSQLDITKADAKKLVDFTFEELCFFLENHETIKLTGFGSFECRHKNERMGCNPKTKKKVPIPPRNVVRFTPGQVLKKKLVKGHEAYGA